MVLADHVYADGEIDYNGRTDSAKHLASSLRALREVRSAFRQTRGNQSNQETAKTGEFLHPAAVVPPLVCETPSPDTAAITEDGKMLNILGRVSGVMLFPGMGGS